MLAMDAKSEIGMKDTLTSNSLTDEPLEKWPPNLTRAQASKYLLLKFGLSARPATLAKWFSIRSDGPRAYVVGRTPLYPRVELDRWAAKRLGRLWRSTSDSIG